VQTTIQDAITMILQAIPGAPLQETVDTVKSGDPSEELVGIVTTCLATHDVIHRTVVLGANLIVTHEPTYYRHLDDTDWLGDDPVYGAKRRLIDDNGIVIWRFHDHWHRHRPDGILTGTARALGWEACAGDEPALFHIEPTTVGDLAAFLKARLGICMVRVVGDLKMPCHRVSLLVGAAGGRRQMRLLRREDVDVVVCGEASEWETPEYVRDAVDQGKPKALITVGHINSEEEGMAWLAEWLRPRFPDVPIAHVPSGDPFQFL
jgi:putative NIF3 family GTP cyclohydrolase 1 type 2